MRAAPGWVRPSVFACARGCDIGVFARNERGRRVAVVRWSCCLLGRVHRREEASWLWLVCAAQGYDQGGGADQEEGGDGGADADE